ncbi:Osteoclast-stimulating factor [Oopsacas minuta]|uniref:Osteoclast-stimulating factor 1 n=1 Tax=Oopsacas minuta TaxID=111878 RepID=A0AAV7JD07_9METZ|nr:Osteoclast-stimulating factor [Oopsacas minuta]
MAKVMAPAPPPPKPGSIRVVQALFPYKAQHVDELSFSEGDLLYIIEGINLEAGWLKAKCKGKIGLIPGNYVETQSESIPNPLQEAAKRGNIEFLNECLQNKVSVNSLDKSGSTAIHWAARGGHIECATALLRYPNIQVNSQNKLGDTPLHNAAWKGDSAIVAILLEAGADITIRNNDKLTPYDLSKIPEVGVLLKQRHGLDEDIDDGGDSD